MAREIIAFQVPSLLKLTEAVQFFDCFGDITKSAFDENRRRTRPFCNLFICYADRVGASRAIAAGSVDIQGRKIRIERSETSLDFGPRETEKFEIRRKRDNGRKRKRDQIRSPSPDQNRRSPRPGRGYNRRHKKIHYP